MTEVEVTPTSVSVFVVFILWHTVVVAGLGGTMIISFWVCVIVECFLIVVVVVRVLVFV